MLHQFLSNNQQDLILRCQIKAALRPPPTISNEAVRHGVPLFLAQLIRMLTAEQLSVERPQDKTIVIAGGDGRQASVALEIDNSAFLHGGELLQHGFTIDQVVHAYGDLCQAITDLASERREPFEINEFRTLNRCLDDAIAGAVTAFSAQRDAAIAEMQVGALTERLGSLAHELRNHIQTATLAFSAVKTGKAGIGGATSLVLDRSLVALRTLVDRSLAEVRSKSGLGLFSRPFLLSQFIAEVRTSASLEAEHAGAILTFSEVDPALAVDAARDLIFSAVGNLLQNAFKFTRPGTEVSLNTYASGERVLIEVMDHCGGLPVSDPESLFTPFLQVGKDKSGVGLGLSISRKTVEANKGTLRVRDVPKVGCVFTIDLPRHAIQNAIQVADPA
jgi:signal transduction histidine kinase